MQPQHDLEKMTLYLTQILSDYEVIPANWGWHIHHGDKYCGHLEYQRKRGWQGPAFNRLPNSIKKQLKKIASTRVGFSVGSATT